MTSYKLPTSMTEATRQARHFIKPMERHCAVLSLALADAPRVIELSRALGATTGNPPAGWLRQQPELQATDRMQAAVFMERAVYMNNRHSACSYVNAIVELLHILIHKPELRKYDPEAMVRMPPHELMEGTCLQRVRDQIDGHETRFKLMLSEKFDELERETRDKDQLVHCRKCNSTNIILDMRQVRSADESMTAFVSCLNCRSCFRMD
jgi:DNA-directed RNA polymerase subunit M/transcription elongation factor TFIIS